MADIEDDIRQHGFAILDTETVTDAGTLGMAYTIGLADAGFPEILVFGLPHQIAIDMLNDAAAMLQKNVLPINEPVKDTSNALLMFKSIPAAIAADYIVQANDRAGKDLSALQLIWTDANGLFPWEAGFASRFGLMQFVL
jgi:hypothetical protein